MPSPSFSSSSLVRVAAAASLGLAVWAAPGTTFAQTPHPHAYGILVGTNVGGAGQQPLRYAEDDARRMADVLKQLGRYGDSDLRVLVRPDSTKVFAAIDEITAKVRADQAKGEQSVFVFYYSGHARASSFSLGGEELAIAAVREKLSKVPSTMTLVVLDACQSGQYARIKGGEPAADFSFNSVSRLTTKGTAVMASSSAQELSQESDELKSSYFTHHLVVGLRGAADGDGDGRVSLDEAYRYAYRRTLASTAQTQVGGQHVTLETELAGQGEVAVTYPADAKSQLELPGALEAKVFVQHKPSGNVVAEVQKAKGAPLRLAFVAGTYEAIVRDASAGLPSGHALRCKLSLSDERVTQLDTSTCESVRLAGLAKGDGGDGDDEITPFSPGMARPSDADMIENPPARAIDPWAIEAGIGFSTRVNDAYTRRLEDFGYGADRGLIEFPRGRAALAVSRGILPHLTLGLSFSMLSGDTYRRDVGDSDDRFTFAGYGASAFLRAATALLGKATPNNVHLDLYGQVGIGLAFGATTLESGVGAERTSSSETHVGFVVSGAGGLAIATRSSPVFFVQGGWDHAPTVSNLTGETHDVGGGSFLMGMRFRFGQ